MSGERRGTDMGAETGKDDACAHDDCADERDELDIAVAGDHRVHEYAATPCEPASQCADQRHQSFLALGVFYVGVGRRIEFLGDSCLPQ